MATRTKKTATAGELEVEETAAPKKAAKKPAARKKTAAKKKTAKKKTAAKKASARRKGADGDLPTVEVDAEDGEATESPKRGKGPHYLVVVESPAKAKTIKKYLGSGYTVKASVGHILDLPKSKMGVDIEHDFEPQYEVIKGKEKVLNELKKAAQGVDKVFLATDPDREGEAIAWHIHKQLGHDNAYRVMFNEITKPAIQEAIAHPRQLSQENYDSQQTRRILDRLVGYQISPLLWKKVRRGLSAGRVQSVAVRLICEREDAIKAFVPQEYWTLDALVQGPSGPPTFKAKLSRVDGKKVELKDKATTDALVADVQNASFVVSKVDKRERRRNAPAPFITSKLQQEAANRLHFTAKKTMALAQRLYEGVLLGEEGQTALITYMRTDSTRLSDQAVAGVRDFIGATWGKDYLPEAPVVYRTKKGAQDAHEAIRPTSLEYPPSKVKAQFDAMNDDMAADMFRLYELIWNRFVACQMMPAVYDQTSADITAGRATFRASGSTLKFPGYLAVYGASLTPEEEAAQEKARAAGEESDEDGVGELPVLDEGITLNLQKLLNEQHFTQPPPRFSEATLVKELEEQGIGRPSTYAAILSTIQDKKYVEKLEGRFRPTDLGVICNELLVKHFPHELDVAFTASMEEKLDQISEGGANWKAVLQDFYAPFKETLEKAEAEMRDVKREEIKTDVACEKCGNVMVIKWGKMGHFLACSNYPECKNTKDFKRDAEGKIVIIEEETTDEKCENCGKNMVVKRGRFGKFLACSGYPECKTSKPISIGVNCPDCKQGYLTERRSRFGKIFFGCNRYPDCKFAAWDRPLPEACPSCQAPYLVQKYSKRDGPFIACPNKECDYRRQIVEPEAAAAAAATPAPAGPDASSAA
ncbi:type I DNA topoisomerase [Archangium violaceum]|uniref:type I DNA topoisomerase n=1 Tax=Archangium violaceum TaxID=83451 RepID=UPI002B28F6EE|nr:type I DNA topoisomerase [Archangium gephyra]